VLGEAGIRPRRVGGRPHPTVRSLAAGAVGLALPWALAIGLLMALGWSPQARAQTLQETWNFIAQDAGVSMPDVADNFALDKSQISNCVVTGEDHSWPNAVMRFRIDFNRLTRPTTTQIARMCLVLDSAVQKSRESLTRSITSSGHSAPENSQRFDVRLRLTSY
jgi:hypothetical protein